MRGNTEGLEIWGKWQVLDWWRLSPGLRLLYKDLKFKPGSSRLLGTNEAGNDPRIQSLLTSSMDLGTQLTLDATFRYVGALPQPHLNAYVELETFASYRVSRSLDLSISGFNLLQARHLEYPDPSGEYIRRLVMAQASLRF
jgi:iron complex outermembrane receptor protein